jgi:DNA polymerase III delta' subunit
VSVSDPRPSRFHLPLVGQDSAVRLLGSWLSNGVFPPLLLSGPAGVGKRTAALMLAQAANCTNEQASDTKSRLSTPDSRPSIPCGVCRNCRSIARLSYPDLKIVLPIRLPRKDSDIDDVAAATLDRYPELALGQTQPVPDPKLKLPIDAVRWLRTEMAKPPLSARRRFFVIVHAHQMNSEAANALLKVLEEPQAQSTFILTSSRPTALLPTIRSRCQTVRFSAVSRPAMRTWLQESAGTSAADAELASALADGSIGSALRFLDDREEFLVAPVVDYFAGKLGRGEQAAIATLEAAKSASPAAIAGTLLFLYRETLRVKLGANSTFADRNPDVIEPNTKLDANYLRRAVKFLLSRVWEAGTNVNARLFNYTLLATLKPPAGTDQKAGAGAPRTGSAPGR